MIGGPKLFCYGRKLGPNWDLISRSFATVKEREVGCFNFLLKINVGQNFSYQRSVFLKARNTTFWFNFVEKVWLVYKWILQQHVEKFFGKRCWNKFCVKRIVNRWNKSRGSIDLYLMIHQASRKQIWVPWVFKFQKDDFVQRMFPRKCQLYPTHQYSFFFFAVLAYYYFDVNGACVCCWKLLQDQKFWGKTNILAEKRYDFF